MTREPATIVHMREALGGMLKNFRIVAGLRQADLARALFVDRTSIAHIERGRARVGEESWKKIDAAVGAEGALLAGFRTLMATKHQIALRAHEKALDKARSEIGEWAAILVSCGNLGGDASQGD